MAAAKQNKTKEIAKQLADENKARLQKLEPDDSAGHEALVAINLQMTDAMNDKIKVLAGSKTKPGLGRQVAQFELPKVSVDRLGQDTP